MFGFINKHAGYVEHILIRILVRKLWFRQLIHWHLLQISSLGTELQVTFQIKGALSICPGIFLALSPLAKAEWIRW